jgi:secondary thiamine-phosphate synthase enzyme
MKHDFNIVGKGVKKIDSLQLAKGKPVFTADIPVEGLLKIKMLWSPLPHARIKNINFEQALNIPGVHAVFCYKNVPRIPHTTAGITINEGADPAVCYDIIERLDELVPRGYKYRHLEGNADSHIKSTIVGTSISIIVDKGRLILGTWQRIFFCEFDGPRTRKVYIKVIR